MRHATPFHWQASGYTLAALMGLCSSFTVGYYAGRRQGTACKTSVQARTLAQMQAQANQFDKLTFYSRLTEDGSKVLPRLPAPNAAATAGSAAAAGPAKPSGLVSAAPAAAPGRAGTPAPKGFALLRLAQDGSKTLPRLAAPRAAAVPSIATAGATPRTAKYSAEHAAVASQAQPGRRPMAALATQHGAYTVQVSSFAHRPEARAFAAALTRQGFTPFVVTKKIPKKGTWYRVRVGRFETREAAVQAQHLLSRADIAAWVVRGD
jgi:DedD protein